MSTYLPKDILAGLAEAKTATLRKKVPYVGRI